METTIQVVLIAVPTAALTALVTWFIAERRIAMKYITEERAKWRDKVRKLALKGYDKILKRNEEGIRRVRSELRVLLNPFSREDRKIIWCMIVNGPRQTRKRRAERFDRRISLLLKHDWERAKLEAGWFLPRWTLRAKRHSLVCDRGKGCKCRARKGLLWWCKKYKFRWWRVLIMVVALSITACVLSHGFRVSFTQDGTTQELINGGEDHGEHRNESLGESQDGF